MNQYINLVYSTFVSLCKKASEPRQWSKMSVNLADFYKSIADFNQKTLAERTARALKSRTSDKPNPHLLH